MIQQFENWRAVDGDTVALCKQRDVQIAYNLRAFIYQHEPESVRLLYLDTPERGQVGYKEATADVVAWMTANWPNLELEEFYPDRGGRMLGDIYIKGERGNTLSQHMLQKGWPPYVRK